MPAAVLTARYFQKEREAIEAFDGVLAAIEQHLDEVREENGGEDGPLIEVIEGEGEKQKITAKAIKDRLREIGQRAIFADERKALQELCITNGGPFPRTRRTQGGRGPTRD